jgi:hypothetical protein
MTNRDRDNGLRRAGTGPQARMRVSALASIAVLATAIAGCGSSSTTTTNSADSDAVTVTVTSPTSGTVINADNVTVRGTVTPTNAVVQIQGQPVAVGNGVFTGTATLHAGKTTIDVIGSAPGHTPDSASITITRQSSAPPAPKTSTATRTVVVPAPAHAQPTASSSSTGEAFYAPSGNVTCSLQSESAECSVASIDMTFVLPSGGDSAYTVGGLTVPRGEGSEAPFDTERTDGEIVCSIPAANVPAGITCRNTTTGHGFEASRVPARQRVY